MRFISFLNRHKTKITGGFLVVMGSLQANAGAIETMMPPRAYAWFTIGIGILVGLLGFMNSRQGGGQ